MLKFESDISSLINAMDESQRDKLFVLIEDLQKGDLDDKLKNQYSKFNCQDILEDIESSNIYERKIKEEKEAVKSGTTTIPKENWGVHITHCCNRHGCKYGHIDCPVSTDLVTQKYQCEDCE